MLQASTIEPATLEILKKLMSIPELADFALVGGTVRGSKTIYTKQSG